jgi:DNA-binding Lrp family transcriptional regulator
MMTQTGDLNPFGTLLDRVFGSEASVRIVRELCAAGVPLGRAEVARRTGLSLPGVGYAVRKLHMAGVVELVGSGARQSVQLRPRHPLAAHLGMLFFVERSYGVAVLDRLREAVAAVSPAPRAAWLEPGDSPAAAAVLTVVVSAREVAAVREQLRRPLAELQDDLDVAVEARVLTKADVEAADEDTTERWRRATPVFGPAPAGSEADAPSATGRRTHGDRDMAALQRAIWVAQRLERDPTLLRRARQWLVTHIPTASPREEHELREWMGVIDGSPVPRIQHVLADPGERGRRLRQSNPFIPVLSERERTQMRKDLAP